jgi:hypothetical protein
MWHDDSGGGERPRVIGVWSVVVRRGEAELFTRLPAVFQQGQGWRMDHCLSVVSVFMSLGVWFNVLCDFFNI